ncbi:MAG: HAD hydrolase-like protein [Alphaproteobacteria bacterium]|nr:HAD hydrolase-like protein [Alphaproteobacteria bacterium]
MSKSLILLIDIDGTLVDTDKHLSYAMTAQYAKYGLHFEPHEFFEPKTFAMPNKDGAMEVATTMLFGASWEVNYYYLKSKIPDAPVDVQTFRKEIVDRVTSNHDGVIPRCDVIETVLALREHCKANNIGFSAVAVTNGAGTEARANLKIVEAEGLVVDGLVNADDVEIPFRKPHPKPYLMGYEIACDVLRRNGYNLEGACVVALEDSPPGARSALAAGEIYDGLCYYIPTTKRAILIPQMTDAQLDRFVVQQDVSALGMHIKTQLHGRGTRATMQIQARAAL